jgi:murein peptide amidase A
VSSSPLAQRERPRRKRGLLALLVAAGIGGGVPIGRADDGQGAAHARTGVRHVAMHTRAAGATAVLGRSVEGRSVRALVLGDPRATRTALVVGCIHGNEPAGISVADRLRGWRPPAGFALWIVPDLNPDGVAADTRQNAHGVDLNRNFPYRWRPLGPRGSQQYAGPRPLSEPESRIAHSLILRLRPRLTIWFHQPLGLTDRSGGAVRLERRFAALSGLPLHQLPRYPGSVTSWQDFRLRHGTAFVVELPPGPPPSRAVARYARAVRLLVAQVATTSHI